MASVALAAKRNVFMNTLSARRYTAGASVSRGPDDLAIGRAALFTESELPSRVSSSLTWKGKAGASHDAGCKGAVMNALVFNSAPLTGAWRRR